MKYLFFFNGQPLLLCCVCSKIAIQDFMTGLHKKNKKNLRFHRRTITRRYFTELKKIYGIVPHSPTESPTDYNPSVFHRELKNIYGVVPFSPKDSPTDINPSVFHRKLQKNYGIVPQSPTGTPTALPTYNTDRITDGFTHIPKRTHV